MKKRIGIILLSLLLLLSAVSCSDEAAVSEAYTLYTAAREQYLAGYDATVRIKVNGVGGDLYVKVNGDTAAAMSATSDHSRYYIDGYLYQSGYTVGGETYDGKLKFQKTKLEYIEDQLQFFGVNPYAAYFPTFSQEALQDISMTVYGSYKSFSATLSAEQIKAYFLNDSLISTAEGTLAASFNANGNMERMVLLMLVTYTDGSQKSFEIRYDFKNIGTKPIILPPEGDYFEM